MYLSVTLLNVLVVAFGYWREGSHQVLVEQPVRSIYLVVGCLRASKLLTFTPGANIAVLDSFLECDNSAVSLG